MKPVSTPPRRVRRALVGTALFGAGYAVDSVGKNLFGSQVFSARTLPPNPVFPAGAVALDVAADSRVGASIGVFFPNDPIQPSPCTQIAAIDVIPPSGLGEGPGSYRLRYDPSRLVAEAVTFPTDPLHVARCTAP
jgi:hypothetical protein